MTLYKVWLVKGATGEYDDARDWIVCGFTNESKALEYAKICDDETKRIWKLHEQKGDKIGTYSACKDFVEQYPPTCDPDMTFDYTGTEYFVTGPIGIEE